MTALGLGLAALGRPGYITVGHARELAGDTSVEAMERRAHEVLDAAYAAGVRWFDTARSYGRGEAFLASWLTGRNIAPADVAVSSKWGYTYVADWHVGAQKHEVKSHDLATLDRQIAESRALLGDQLDLYQIHSATLDSGVLDADDVLARLGELRDSGLPIGLSLSGPGQRETLERALTVEVGGKPLFSAVQATWNLLERSVDPALRTAKHAGLRVLVKEALANGRLAGAAAPEALRAYAASKGVGADAVAIAAALAQPFVDVVLSGAVTPVQLRANLRALTVDGSEAALVLASLVESPQQYWTERAGLPWN
ncbi:MAG: aldo/keto reductase [Kofleriaceae bacterium]|nr:aldo/keto reductase [Kofleriaceae bacterium]